MAVIILQGMTLLPFQKQLHILTFQKQKPAEYFLNLANMLLILKWKKLKNFRQQREKLQFEQFDVVEYAVAARAFDR